MRFTKMQGCGNDYIYINCFEEKVEDPGELSIRISNRNFGAGSDGLVLIMPSEKGDFRMRMFNSDGSEAEMCGNAIRCVGKFVYDRGLCDKTGISVETKAGMKYLDLHAADGKVSEVTVDMGEPILKGRLIPVESDDDPVMGKEIEILDRKFSVTCVSMGNPHAVTFVENVKDFPVEKYGREMEIHGFFPKKTNVEFVRVIDNGTLEMRVWERGAGETLACGTGACATLVAAVLNGLCGRRAVVRLLGGDLFIEWNENDNHIYMRGPAEFSYDGVWLKAHK